ncbi:aminopeptidase P family N-terminal domain-containing protein [Micromonospora sp. WMMA1363]|uniref:aminopeptidase P family N-terminal domain-containing protein n=1 Tax=Micromonospora sp. WMMA1363 TaxID=3053985 RepID=UPI00259C7E1B|nr:aminopeptidase P family N-terminal domain-containing protein [Micromonospora sp. WMMA1363]MDM4719221.1 aminopeptidase P family N-terminal domain-containing protein [Micromonospora sp. WMMA1363]
MGLDALYPPGRLAAARRATAAAGLDALLLSPGSDLCYLTGYDAHPGERLTLLVVPAEGTPTLIVPTLERPAAEASPAPATGVRIVDHGDGTDPYPLVAAALGGPVAAVGLADRMWAEQVLALRAALPGATQRLASDVLRELRIRRSPAEVAALAEAGAAIDAVHQRMGEWLRPGRTEREVAAGNTRALEPGMAFSIEPGIYLPGRHGARIEDIVVCTTDGVRRLNTTPTELIAL